ncbi:hypothetical protein ACWE42_03590 [Sutcliffiella cohnii]|nr:MULTISPECIES: hypothetical protein [Sutcliffiella]MED4014697.1 hypothetical protein [Sutcliffiella cohnii]WBL12964.1 hypothetical protein O1A01_13550 [Sutcliffiella sp. NC1]
MKKKDDEILACNQEVSKELFQKELEVIVTDGIEAAMEQEELERE